MSSGVKSILEEKLQNIARHRGDIVHVLDSIYQKALLEYDTAIGGSNTSERCSDAIDNVSLCFVQMREISRTISELSQQCNARYSTLASANIPQDLQRNIPHSQCDRSIPISAAANLERSHGSQPLLSSEKNKFLMSIERVGHHDDRSVSFSAGRHPHKAPPTLHTTSSQFADPFANQASVAAAAEWGDCCRNGADWAQKSVLEVGGNDVFQKHLPAGSFSIGANSLAECDVTKTSVGSFHVVQDGDGQPQPSRRSSSTCLERFTPRSSVNDLSTQAIAEEMLESLYLNSCIRILEDSDADRLTAGLFSTAVDPAVVPQSHNSYHAGLINESANTVDHLPISNFGLIGGSHLDVFRESNEITWSTVDFVKTTNITQPYSMHTAISADVGIRESDTSRFQMESALRDMYSEQRTVQLCEYIIESAVDLDEIDAESRTRLNVALHGKPSLQLIEALLLAGASVTPSPRRGCEPPLITAMRNRQPTNICAILRDYGADVDSCFEWMLDNDGSFSADEDDLVCEYLDLLRITTRLVTASSNSRATQFERIVDVMRRFNGRRRGGSWSTAFFTDEKNALLIFAAHTKAYGSLETLLTLGFRPRGELISLCTPRAHAPHCMWTCSLADVFAGTGLTSFNRCGLVSYVLLTTDNDALVELVVQTLLSYGAEADGFSPEWDCERRSCKKCVKQILMPPLTAASLRLHSQFTPGFSAQCESPSPMWNTVQMLMKRGASITAMSPSRADTVSHTPDAILTCSLLGNPQFLFHMMAMSGVDARSVLRNISREMHPLYGFPRSERMLCQITRLEVIVKASIQVLLRFVAHPGEELLQMCKDILSNMRPMSDALVASSAALNAQQSDTFAQTHTGERQSPMRLKLLCRHVIRRQLSVQVLHHLTLVKNNPTNNTVRELPSSVNSCQMSDTERALRYNWVPTVNVTDRELAHPTEFTLQACTQQLPLLAPSLRKFLIHQDETDATYEEEQAFLERLRNGIVVSLAWIPRPF